MDIRNSGPNNNDIMARINKLRAQFGANGPQNLNQLKAFKDSVGKLAAETYDGLKSGLNGYTKDMYFSGNKPDNLKHEASFGRYAANASWATGDNSQP